MEQFDEEVIDLTTEDDPKSCDRDKIDRVGNSHATLAVITNHNLGDCDVGYRVGEDPDVASYLFHRLGAGDFIEIRGYESIRDIRFVNVGTADAKLYAAYYA